MGYDVIGDVHGQNLKLKALLVKLGYRVRHGAWRHPEGRVAVFVGDLIDRGGRARSRCCGSCRGCRLRAVPR